jgi:hypothetical protein
VAALSQLAKVLCAPGNDDGVDDAAARADAVPKISRASAAAKLEAQVTRLLSEGSATRRATGSFLLASWLDAIPVGAPKPPLAQPGARLGELLAATDPAYPSAPSPAPYAEVASLVARVKRESAGLLRAAADNNVRPTTSEVPSPAADGFGAAHAATLAAAIPAVRRRRLPVSSVRSCFSRSRFSVSVSVRRASSFFQPRRGEPIGVSASSRSGRLGVAPDAPSPFDEGTTPELPQAKYSPRAKGHSRFPHA